MSGPRYSIIPGDAVFDERVSHSMLRVLNTLGTHTNGQGWCVVNQAKVGARLRLSRESVNRAIRKLVDLGYVEKETRLRNDGGVSISRYRVIMDRREPDTTADADGPHITPYDDETAENQNTPVTPTSQPPVIPRDHSPCDPQTSQLNDPYNQRPSSVVVSDVDPGGAFERASAPDDDTPPHDEGLNSILVEAVGLAARTDGKPIGNLGVVRKWIDQGVPLAVIVEAVREKARAMDRGSLRSWRFMNGPIGDHVRDRKPDRPAARKPSKPRDPATLLPRQWRLWIMRWLDGGQWFDTNGPAPGEPGCLVPDEVLADVLRAKGDDAIERRKARP